MSEEKTLPQASAPKLVSAVVAPRRTVRYRNPGETALKVALPGETVNLPVEEVRRLRKEGFLVNPEAVKTRQAEGPSLHSAAGVRVNPDD